MQNPNSLLSTPFSMVSVLKIKPFFILWVSQIISQIAFNMLTFILGVMVYEQARTNTAVSILYLTVGLPGAIFGVISGVLVDRFDKKQVLVSTTFIRAGLLFLMLMTRSYLLFIYLLMILVSIFSQFFVPAEASLIPRFVPKQFLLSANSLFTMTFYSAIIGGFSLGGPLLNLLGHELVLVFLIVLFAISGGLLLFLPNIKFDDAFEKSPESIHWFDDLRQALWYIKENIPVKQAILLVTLAQVVIAVFVTLGPGFVDRILVLKFTDASTIILGPAAIGMVAGALLVGNFGQHIRKRKLINIGIFASAILLIFISSLTGDQHRITRILQRILTNQTGYILPVTIVSFVLLGVANSLIDVACNTVLQEKTSDKMRGKIYGILQSLIGGVSILPVVISGVLADLFGVGKFIFWLGLILTGVGFYTSGVWHKLRKELIN